MRTYIDYKNYVSEDIKNCLDKMGCQPILFIGSGLSQRYINAPTWDNLLDKMADKCPLIDKNVAYYKQSDKSSIEIGSIFSTNYKDWAWSDGRSNFPDDFFSSNYKFDIFIKYCISNFLNNILLNEWQETLDDKLKNEISLLKEIAPHAIITTNYDNLLETIFPDYQTIIGQKILKTNIYSFGELFKIHGCITEPQSLVLHEEDYKEFHKTKKYLSAKLLTFFAEHPLLFVGYSASDPNIKAILSDIDEIISNNGDSIDNIYMLEYDTSINENSYPATEKIIHLDDKSITVKSIRACDFDWVFEAFINSSLLQPINPKLLRALLARSYDLVRCDVPRGRIEVNYETLQGIVDSDKELPSLLGMTKIDDVSKVNVGFPYTITAIAEILGYKSWNPVDKLIKKIKYETSIDIKTSDNKYHLRIKTGSSEKSESRKYSQDAIDLLQKVKDGLPYEVDI